MSSDDACHLGSTMPAMFACSAVETYRTSAVAQAETVSHRTESISGKVMRICSGSMIKIRRRHHEDCSCRQSNGNQSDKRLTAHGLAMIFPYKGKQKKKYSILYKRLNRVHIGNISHAMA